MEINICIMNDNLSEKHSEKVVVVIGSSKSIEKANAKNLLKMVIQ
jgi:hypothetical protein